MATGVLYQMNPQPVQQPLSAVDTFDLNKAAGQMAGASNVSVTNDSLASKQLEKLLAKDSALLQTARTKAAQASAGRGLLNSSIGVQAGEQAVIETATPLATSDASTYANAARDNANAANQFALASNSFGREGALAKFNVMTRREDNLDEQMFRRGESALDRQQQMTMQGMDFSFRAGESNADRAQRLEEQARDFGFRGEQAGLDRNQQMILQDKQFTFQGDQASRDRTQQTMIQKLQESGMDARQAATIVADERARASAQQFQAAQAGLDRNQQLILQDADFTFRYDQGTLDRNQQTMMQRLQESGMDFRQATQLSEAARQAGLDRSQQQFLQDDNQVFQAMQMNAEQQNMIQRMGYADQLQQGQVRLQDTISKANLTTNMKVALAERSQTAIMQIMADPNLSAVRPKSPPGALSPKEQAIQNVNNYVQQEIDRIIAGFSTGSSSSNPTGWRSNSGNAYVGR